MATETPVSEPATAVPCEPDVRASGNPALDDAVAQRRAAAGIDASQELWGLALSGGGVRSATFCLGLLRGLARNGLLRHFDFLSTVSGGGYVGSSLGRLYGTGHGADEVEAGVARDDSLWLWWLRSNGRYLTPAGAKDLGFAGASIVRGILATHGELAVLVFLLAGIVLLPHLLVTMLAQFGPPDLFRLTVLSVLGSAWWWLALLPLFLVVRQLFAYWFYRVHRRVAGVVAIGLALLASAALALYEIQRWFVPYTQYVEGAAEHPPGYIALRLALGVLLLAPLAGFVAAMATRGPRCESAARLLWTKRLATSLWLFTAAIFLGLLDHLSWRLADMFWRWGDVMPAVGGALSLTALVAIARFILPHIKEALARSKFAHVNVERFLNFLGLAMAALLVLAWTTVFHVLMLPDQLWQSSDPAPWYMAVQLHYWLALVGVPLVYVLMSRRALDVINLASLHNYYRGRIERAYVSSGNWGAAGARFKQHPLCPVTRVHKGDVAPLVDSIDGDDVDLEDYAPHHHGGPIHIINCCINQSVDDRTGNYNADRKGVALGLSALGVETGISLPVPPPGPTRLGTLSKWIAISGAAASTGMGSNTSPGLAALLFMSGLRLGYWTPTLADADGSRRQAPSWADKRGLAIFRWMPKPVAIVAEFLARFPGLGSVAWYVSDGGHFDNTGIYPLLKREVGVIVAADCGADPKYLFSDLETLVRKAEIDFGARIEFINPDTAVGDAALGPLLGTPESIGPEPGSRCLVLGRIFYASGKTGTLLVAKPCRLEKMPFDVVAYADRNASFPQQTTSDQFFDEAQWESYHRLGLLIGGRINSEAMASAKALAAAAAASASSLTKAMEASASESATTRRERIGTTVRASIGAGVSLSVLIAAWQGYQQYAQGEREARTQYFRDFSALAAQVTPEAVDGIDAHEFQLAKAGANRFNDEKRYRALVDKLANVCDGHREDGEEAVVARCDELQNTASLARPISYWMQDVYGRREDGRVLPTLATAGGVAGSFDGGDAVDAVAAPATDGALDADDLADAVDAADAATGDGGNAAAVAGQGARPGYRSAGADRRMPTSAAADTGADAPAEPDAGTCDPATANGIRLYVQVYDEATRPLGLAWVQRAKEAGFQAGSVENVTAAAERQGRRTPFQWSRPTLIHHQDVPDACRYRLGELMPGQLSVRALPTSLKGSPGVMELWLPPSDQALPKQAR